MTVLKNSRHERFAQELASGVSASTAYVRAGYKPSTSNAAVLKGKQRISERVAALLAEREAINAQSTAAAIQRAALTKEWVLERLMRNARIALGEERITIAYKPKNMDMVIELDVTDRDAAEATKALELLGKEIGLWQGGSAPPSEQAAIQGPQTASVIDFVELRKTFPRSFTMEPQK